LSEAIAVRDTIHSAHRLPGYRGECRFVHGFSWHGAIRISCERFPRDDRGVSLDPDRLRAILRRFDHRLIVAAGDGALLHADLLEPDGIVVIAGRAPSAENLASAVFHDVVRCIGETFPDRAARYTIHVSVAESEDDIFSVTHEETI
jgi:6-pyruvoyl-tetrahydropterin synthase